MRITSGSGTGPRRATSVASDSASSSARTMHDVVTPLTIPTKCSTNTGTPGCAKCACRSASWAKCLLALEPGGMGVARMLTRGLGGDEGDDGRDDAGEGGEEGEEG